MIVERTIEFHAGLATCVGDLIEALESVSRDYGEPPVLVDGMSGDRDVVRVTVERDEGDGAIYVIVEGTSADMQA